MKNIRYLLTYLLLGSVIFSSQSSAMEEDELKSRFLSSQPSGKVMQRDLRLIAQVEITNSDDMAKKGFKHRWMFRGPLPYDYEHVLTEPILTALRDCPEEIRSGLEERRCYLAFNFDIAGTICGPVFARSGFETRDSDGELGRCVTVLDKNGLNTNIFW